MEELSRNIPDEMENSMPVDPPSPIIPDKPLPPSPVASSDNEHDFHTPSPNIHESGNSNTTTEEPVLDLHDSLLIFDIRPPEPPALPAVTASTAELHEYGTRLESYQKEWNEYGRKMCQYHDERAAADSLYDIQYYMSTGAMQRYLRAMIQDIEVKNQWQLAQRRHCEVLEAFLQFKIAQEVPRA
jgi:hypothetical protein